MKISQNFVAFSEYMNFNSWGSIIDIVESLFTEFHLLNHVQKTLAFSKWRWISKTSIGNSEFLDVRFPNNFWKIEQNDDNLFTVWTLQSSQNATILLFCIHWAIWKPSSQLNGSNNEPIRPVVRGFGSWLAFLWMPFNYCATPIPQFFIQLLYELHVRTVLAVWQQ